MVSSGSHEREPVMPVAAAQRPVPSCPRRAASRPSPPGLRRPSPGVRARPRERRAGLTERRRSVPRVRVPSLPLRSRPGLVRGGLVDGRAVACGSCSWRFCAHTRATRSPPSASGRCGRPEHRRRSRAGSGRRGRAAAPRASPPRPNGLRLAGVCASAEREGRGSAGRGGAGARRPAARRVVLRPKACLEGPYERAGGGRQRDGTAGAAQDVFTDAFSFWKPPWVWGYGHGKQSRVFVVLMFRWGRRR